MNKLAGKFAGTSLLFGLLVWFGTAGQAWSAPDKFVATFNQWNYLNNVGGAFGSFVEGLGSGSTIAYTNVASDVKEGDLAQKIDIQVGAPLPAYFCGLWMKLGPSTSTPLNVSNQSYYSFWAKGFSGGEKFTMELKSTGAVAVIVLTGISGFGNGLSTQYQNVVVALSSFTNNNPALDLTKLTELTFVFKADMWGSTKTIYVDDFRFISNPSPEAYPGTPTLYDPSASTITDRNGIYDIDWTDTSNTTAYEIWTSTDPTFTPPGAPYISVNWTFGATTSILYYKEVTTNGTYYNKVRGWSQLPENDGVSGSWSNAEDVNVILGVRPSTPTLQDPGGTIKTSTFILNWSNEGPSGAVMYEVQEALTSNFSTVNRFFYPSVNAEAITAAANDTTFYYRVRAFDGTPHPGEGLASGYSNVESVHILVTSKTFTFDDVKQVAFTMSQVAYSSPQKTNEPQLDWPADSQPNSLGMVFEEANSIGGDKAFDDGDWVITLRPRAGFDPRPTGSPHKLEEVLEEVWISGGSNVYDLRAFELSNYDYSSPNIIPPVDFNTLGSTSNWQYNMAAWVIHKATYTDTLTGYITCALLEASGYSRFSAFPPMRIGASPRLLLMDKDKNYANSERFPILRRLWIKRVGPEKLSVMAVVDVEAYTAALQYDILPNFMEARYEVTSVIYPRRTVYKSEGLGFGGFSSLYRNPDYPEAHDFDTLIVKYADGDATERRPVFLSEGSPSTTIYYSSDTHGSSPIGFMTSQEDTNNTHYVRNGDVRYAYRTSYSNDLSTASKPVRVRHYHFPPREEFDDNTVTTFEFDVDLQTATALTDGVTVQYTWRSYFASPILEDGEGNDQSPRVTYWNNIPIVNFNGYNVAVSTDQAHGGAKSLKVTYNKSSQWDWYSYDVPAGEQNYNRDFGRSDSLSFWVYGNNVPILIKLKDGAGVESADIATLNAASTSTWTKLTYRYDWARGGTLNMSDIQKILVFVDPGVSGSNGTIYMDDFQLDYLTNGVTGSKGVPMLIDSLEDGDVTPSGKDGLSWSDEVGSNYAYTAPTDRASDGTRSLKVVYTKTSTSTFLRGTIELNKYPELENWLDYSGIRMDVSEAGNEDVDIQVNMTNEQNNDYVLDLETVVNKSGAEESQFQTLTFDFSDVKQNEFGRAFERITRMRINVEPFCSNCTGTIYIDNIHVVPLPAPTLFDNFEDNTLTEYPGGMKWGDLDSGQFYTLSASTSNPYALYSSTRTMKVVYNKTSQYQFFYSDVDPLRQSELRDWRGHSGIRVPVRGNVDLLMKLADTNNTTQATWNVGSANQAAGVGWSLSSTDNRLSSFTAVRLWARGASGGETFRIGMKDTFNNEKFLLSSNYASVTSGGFTKFEIPLTDFSGVNMSSVSNVTVSFKNSTTTASGTLYIDEVRFLNSDGWRVLDDFNDTDPNNANGFGGYKFEWTENGGTMSTSLTNFSIEQDVSPILTATQANDYTLLEFDYSSLARDTNINLGDIKRILYDINPNVASSNGTVYIDDISFK